jgi:diadenylate cyclase
MTKNGKILHNMSFQEIRDTINEFLNNEDVDDRFEDIQEYQFQKKRKLAMTNKNI